MRVCLSERQEGLPEADWATKSSGSWDRIESGQTRKRASPLLNYKIFCQRFFLLICTILKKKTVAVSVLSVAF